MKATIISMQPPRQAGANGTASQVVLSDNYSGDMYWHNDWGPMPAQGAEIEYNPEQSEYGPKVKIVRPRKTGGGGFGKSDPAKNESIEKQVCLKSAVKYVNSNPGEFKPSQVVDIAKMFHDWISGKEAPPANVSNPPVPEWVNESNMPHPPNSVVS